MDTLFVLSLFVIVNLTATKEYKNGVDQYGVRKLSKTINGFTWKSCGGTSAVFTDLSINPDPLMFPGTITIGATLNITQNIMAPLKTSLLIEKCVDGKCIKIPCFGSIGSCEYDDLCELLDQITQCPDPLVAAGIPCQCPFKSKVYKLPEANFEIDAEFLPDGDIHLKGSISSGGKELGCLDIYASVAS